MWPLLKVVGWCVDACCVGVEKADAEAFEVPGDQPCEPPITRQRAIFLGWNDAAWGRPRRLVAPAVSRWYELGYAGGLAFKLRHGGDASQ
jgi:hypothetical protein